LTRARANTRSWRNLPGRRATAPIDCQPSDRRPLDGGFPAPTGKKGAIGWAQRRAPPLPTEHGKLMSQDEQLDVFGELAAATADQQSQHSREGEIGEGKEHAPMLPSPATGRRQDHRS
jgi:hypothetical protein